MKLKDLPNNTMVNTVVLYMPKRIFNTTKETGLNTQRVIFRCPFSSPTGFWVTVEPKHADKMGWNKNRVFPVGFIQADTVLEWRILKILKS